MKYFRPKTFDEYYSISEQDFALFAGGTDLIPRYERGQKLPDAIIDLKKLPDLNGMGFLGFSFQIGAATTIEKLKNNPIIKGRFSALHQATIDFGSVQIRNRATIGGNICNASPSGDLLPALYAFEAMVILESKNGKRLVPIQDFIVSPGKTTLKNGEVLQSIIMPEPYSKSLFYKLGLREAMAISIINFAIVYEDNKLTIAIGAVAPTIINLTGLYNLSVNQILEKVDDMIFPIDDIRATAKYRRKALQNMLRFELSKIIK